MTQARGACCCLSDREASAELSSSTESCSPQVVLASLARLASPVAVLPQPCQPSWVRHCLHQEQDPPTPEMAAEDLAHLLQREQASTPPPGWLRAHASVTAPQRDALAAWLRAAVAGRRWGLPCAELAVSLLDRFLALSHFGADRDWAMQLGAVACLGIAAKVDGSDLPPSLDRLQDGPAPAPWVPFAPSAVLRMELAVLTMLGWAATGPDAQCLRGGAAGGGALRRRAAGPRRRRRGVRGARARGRGA